MGKPMSTRVYMMYLQLFRILQHQPPPLWIMIVSTIFPLYPNYEWKAQEVQLEVNGNRLKDWLKQCWLDTLHSDMKIICLHPDQDHDWEKERSGPMGPALSHTQLLTMAQQLCPSRKPTSRKQAPLLPLLLTTNIYLRDRLSLDLELHQPVTDDFANPL